MLDFEAHDSVDEVSTTLLAFAEAIVDAPGRPTDETLDHLVGDERDLADLLAAVSKMFEPEESTGDPLLDAGTWGDFELIDSLGSGAFGQVYRALDRKTQREVALKIYRDRPDASGQHDLLREGRLLARVRHENVAMVYAIAEHQGRVGVVMELIEGETLAARVERDGPLDVEDVVSIGIDISRALDALHSVRIIHRDVKAENVICRPDGRAVLVDLGIGAETGEDSAPMGTPLYLAPEIFRGESATPKSDIYSLGVLLFYLATGRYPLEAESFQEIEGAHQSEVVASPASQLPSCPESFRTAVSQCLAREPAARPFAARCQEQLLGASDHCRGSTEHRLSRRKAITSASGFVFLVLLGLSSRNCGRKQDEEIQLEVEPADIGAVAFESFRRGVSCYRDGEHEIAISALVDSVEKNPANPSAWLYLGWSYRAVGQMDEALSASKRAYDLIDMVPARLRCSVERTYFGDRLLYKEALHAARNCVDRRSLEAEDLGRVADFSTRLGKFSDAVRLSKHAASIGRLKEQFSYFHHLFRASKIDEAKEACAVLRKEIDDSPSYLDWIDGMISIARADLFAAQEYFMSLANAGSAFVGTSLFYLSTIDIIQGDFTKARFRIDAGTSSQEVSSHWKSRLSLLRLPICSQLTEREPFRESLNKLLSTLSQVPSNLRWLREAGRLSGASSDADSLETIRHQAWMIERKHPSPFASAILRQLDAEKSLSAGDLSSARRSLEVATDSWWEDYSLLLTKFRLADLENDTHERARVVRALQRSPGEGIDDGFAIEWWRVNRV